MQHEMKELQKMILNQLHSLIKECASTGEPLTNFDDSIDTLLIDNDDPKSHVIVDCAHGCLTPLQAKNQIDQLERLKAFW